MRGQDGEEEHLLNGQDSLAPLRPAPADLPAILREVIEYRKSGLSLNHIVGCPLECSYCVRHLFANYDMKRPHLVLQDEDAVDQLIGHWAFRPHTTPVQILNRATDPFLPRVKDHLFAVLEDLDRRALRNLVLVITRWRVTLEDVERLEALRHIRVTVLVTWSGITDSRIEPVDSAEAERSLAVLAKRGHRTKTIFYWRPLIAGLNDTDDHLDRARHLAASADATVFTGLFFREQIRSYFRGLGVEDVYDNIARRKILPYEVERRALGALAGLPAFRKTSCGVAFAHAVPDYNGHFGINELCEICPAKQVGICKSAWHKPELTLVSELDLLRKSGEFPCDERRAR
jgi:DNA repair photolyase